jgi:glycosyltransferase involved in cell wall biosynthesis
MKILMLAPQPFFESRGTPFSVLARLRALSALGHEVDLLTYHIGQDVSVAKVAIHRTPRIRFIKTVKVGPSLTKLFLDILLFIKAISFLRKKHYDVLHTHEEAGFFGSFLAKFFRMPHIYDMHSSLPEQLSNFHYSQFRVLVFLFKYFEHQTIKSSDLVITICPALQEHVKKINAHVLQVMIENGANETYPKAISEEDAQKFAAAYSLDGKKIVLYAGTFEPYQGLDLLVDSAKQIVDRYGDVLFLLMGGTSEQVVHYQQRVEALGLSGYFCFTGTRPPEEIPRATHLSQILVSPRLCGINTPLKIYAYLQSGKPIIATDILSHTQILDANVAVLVEPTPEAFARGVLSVLDNPPLSERLGIQARRLYEERYSYASFLEKTEQALLLALR